MVLVFGPIIGAVLLLVPYTIYFLVHTSYVSYTLEGYQDIYLSLLITNDSEDILAFRLSDKEKNKK